MSSNKNLDELISESKETFEKFATEADITLKHLKKKAKRQRVKMRKRGIKVVQDYCN